MEIESPLIKLKYFDGELLISDRKWFLKQIQAYFIFVETKNLRIKIQIKYIELLHLKTIQKRPTNILLVVLLYAKN
jgi:hypothetical protein